MSNEFWTIFKQLAKDAEKKAMGNSESEYNKAYMKLKQYIDEHAPMPPIVWSKK